MPMEPLRTETIEKTKQAGAVLLGAVGGPKWDNVDFDIRPEAGLLAIRKERIIREFKTCNCFRCFGGCIKFET